jgi:hypothetical protein
MDDGVVPQTRHVRGSNQARIGVFDVGADEFSTAAIVRKPLNAEDVGPNWRITSPNDGGLAEARFIQAEDFAVILDPDADNVNWVTQSTANALGGQSMRSPFHDLVDRPTDPHESLLVYDIEFSETGTYTAYYRGRGFDSGSDSIYVADDFGVDPESIETLSDNGVFRWEVGGTFDISSADIDVPLEYRVGSRERFADFDAFVFHLNANLSPSQLDALFSIDIASVDLNSDGAIDCADIDSLVAAIASGSSDTRFDLTGDGQIDNDDLTDWLANAGAINLASSNPYLEGDTNLDGVVDISDFNLWNSNKFTSDGGWCSADFNADGFTDISDFNLWNRNKFQSSDASAVPEPQGIALWGVVACCLLGIRRRLTN